MRLLASILLVLSFAVSAQAQIDNSDCPTGRSGQLPATRANFLNVLAKGTRWYNPGHRSSHFINMIGTATFKLGYNGQAKRAAREILVENDIGNTKFSGALVISGKLRVELDEIYFTIKEGRCTLVTKTNPDEYHPSTVNFPRNDMNHHKIMGDDGDFVTIPWSGGQTVHVLRSYQWIRDENFQ